MNAPRVFLPADQWPEDDRVELSAKESHHISHVLRLGLGDALEIFDGQGRVAEARVEAIQPHRPVEVVFQQVEQHTVACPRIQVLQALTKPQRMDLIVQKGVELGVSDIWPMAAVHCVLKLNPAQAAKRVARWQRIAVEAAKQCGAAYLPVIHPVENIDAVLAQIRPDIFWVGALHEGAVSLRRAWEDMRHRDAGQPVSDVAFAIGPEGDFSDGEYRQLEQAGARPVGLGPRVLRTETASLFMMSAVRLGFLAEPNADG